MKKKNGRKIYKKVTRLKENHIPELKKEIENTITRLRKKAEEIKEQEDIVIPGRRKPRKRKKTKVKKVERERREDAVRQEEEKGVREGESLLSKRKPTPGSNLLMRNFMSKFKAPPDQKSKCRPIRKSISRDNSSNLIEGQLKLISRRGAILLSRPGKGLKGKFQLQEPGGKERGVMGPTQT